MSGTNSKATEMEELLATLQLNQQNESLKQQKATTTKINIETDLFEDASKLTGQTQAVHNVREVVDIITIMRDQEVDIKHVKNVNLLLAVAIKRARDSYK